MTSAIVNVDNFARAETDRMFAALLADSGGVNEWRHFREPTPLDHQPVIRQNRDTLYSANIADISQGATLTIPDRGERYLSVMIVNQDHYINRVFHDAGDYELTIADFDTPYVLVAVRTLVDPADASDVAAVNALQDRFALRAQSARPFVLPDYDQASFDGTRAALLELNTYMTGFSGAFGSKAEVDPVRHLVATAAGWGGLPEKEASYFNVVPGLPAGAYELTVRDVPVDGFWSVSLYNADGYFPADEPGAVSVNNITAVRDADGSVTIHFGGEPDLPNRLPTMDGWNYLVRFYQPRREILDGSWTFPVIQPA
jgi:hypothetical protein